MAVFWPALIQSPSSPPVREKEELRELLEWKEFWTVVKLRRPLRIAGPKPGFGVFATL